MATKDLSGARAEALQLALIDMSNRPAEAIVARAKMFADFIVEGKTAPTAPVVLAKSSKKKR